MWFGGKQDKLLRKEVNSIGILLILLKSWWVFQEIPVIKLKVIHLGKNLLEQSDDDKENSGTPKSI